MARKGNKYFNIERETKIPDFSKYKGHHRIMKISLTAIAGFNSRKGVLISIDTKSDVDGETGKAFITLDTVTEIKSMIDALQLRLDGQISAVGDMKLPSIINGKLIT